MKDLRRQTWINGIIWLLCSAIVLASAAFNLLSRQQP
jgi:hypothetical protein